MLVVIETSSETLPLYYVTSDDRRKDASRCQQLYAIDQIALYVITTKKNSIVHRNVNRGLNLETN